MFIKRAIEPEILQGSQYFPVIAIVGPRQSGKTTVARHLFTEHRYISLEDLDARSAAKNDPRTFLIANATQKGLIIDEFQYVPELLSYIQTIVDEEKKPGFFILTGSQNFLVNEKISQSLAGRVSIHTLLPLSTRELKNNNLLPKQIESILFKGCYPAIYSEEIPLQRLYSNYLQTYVERDVRQLTQVGDLTTFQTFIQLCAARVGQLINFSSLANECRISDKTAKRWLSILQTSYIVFLLQPYHKNYGKRLVKTPKLFFYDTGLLCHILKIKKEDLAMHPYRGNIFEAFIISDILKWYFNHGNMPRIYFWRDKVGHEIDCLIDEGKKILPVEIKASRTTSGRFFENLNYWKNLAQQNNINDFVIYAGPEKQVRTHHNLLSWQDLSLLFNAVEK